jgi:hypothetical protein
LNTFTYMVGYIRQTLKHTTYYAENSIFNPGS